jgi:hypothetical protein
MDETVSAQFILAPYLITIRHREEDRSGYLVFVTEKNSIGLARRAGHSN